MRCTSFGDPLQAIFCRDRKTARESFGKKGKSTGFIYVPGSKFREAEGHLSMRSYLQDYFINSSPRIGKYIDKHEFYRQYPPRRVKDTNISEIKILDV